MRDVRVCLVGDEGVGKSSIISALIKQVPFSRPFVRLAPRTVLPEVTIPPSVTPGHDVTTVIIDTSPHTDTARCGGKARPQDRNHLVNEIRKAHVVAIVCPSRLTHPDPPCSARPNDAIDNPTTFDRVPTYWLPTIRSLGVNVPVILIGNKIDLREGQVTNQALEDEIVPIMQEYKEVETCVECSALLPLNISEVFFFAQNAVLHPTAPLYDTREHSLKPSCVSALSRIFRLIDTDKDGLLSPDELNDFQRLVFDAPLQAREIEGVREVVEQMTGGSGIEGDAVNEEGWLALHTYFVQKGRLETTWRALRCFGYGEDLMLREEFLYPRFDIPFDCTAELSPKGYQIGMAPSPRSNSPTSSPRLPGTHGPRMTTITTPQGAVTLQGWLAQWSMTTLLEPRITLAYLAYLGYPHSSASLLTPSPPSSSSSSSSSSPHPNLIPTTSALQVTRPRRPSRRKGTPVDRNVFLAYVLGAAGSGKTSLLRAFVGKGFDFEEEERGRRGLQEFGSTYESEVLRNKKKLELADVLVFVYDSSDTNSFSYISNLRQQYKLDDIPSLFVATKSDLDLAQQVRPSLALLCPCLSPSPAPVVTSPLALDKMEQRHEVQPDTYCRKLSVRVPLAVSVKRGELADLFHTIVRIAIHPRVSLMIYTSAGLGAVAIGMMWWSRGGGGGGWRSPLGWLSARWGR
ncbi:SPOSA6832_04359, partial [Sporobolomyces salmonicolor]